MSDAKIRELERIAFETQQPQDIANYWRVCLRSGVSPKENSTQVISGDTEDQFLTEHVWTLAPNNWEKQPYISIVFYPEVSAFGSPVSYISLVKKQIPIWGHHVENKGRLNKLLLMYLEELLEPGTSLPGVPNARNNPGADQKIRELERIAAISKKSDDIANYWSACFRADILPNPTLNRTDDDYESYAWTLHPEAGMRFDNRFIQMYRPKLSFTRIGSPSYPQLSPEGENLWSVYLNSINDNIGSNQTNYHTTDSAHNTVKDYLPNLLKPLKNQNVLRNPSSDSRIRELERLAFETQESQNIANYWRESLRAGIIPKPTVTRREGENLERDAHYWTLWPKKPWDLFFGKWGVSFIKMEKFHNFDRWNFSVNYLVAGTILMETDVTTEVANILIKTELPGLLKLEENLAKRNPDEKIRRLSRSPSDKIQAAIETLRAGQPLTPTTEHNADESNAWSSKRFDFDSRVIYLRFFNPRSIVVAVELSVLCQTPGMQILPWNESSKYGLPRDWQLLTVEFKKNSEIEAHPKIMELMYEALITPETPIKETPIKQRKNPDEKLRRYQRENSSIQTSIEQLRAGIPLIPQNIFEKTHLTNGFSAIFDFDDRKIHVDWKIYPADYIQIFDIEFLIASKAENTKIQPPGWRNAGRKLSHLKIINCPLTPTSPWTNLETMEALYEALIAPAEYITVKRTEKRNNPRGEEPLRRLEKEGILALAKQPEKYYQWLAEKLRRGEDIPPYLDFVDDNYPNDPNICSRVGWWFPSNKLIIRDLKSAPIKMGTPWPIFIGEIRFLPWLDTAWDFVLDNQDVINPKSPFFEEQDTTYFMIKNKDWPPPKNWWADPVIQEKIRELARMVLTKRNPDDRGICPVCGGKIYFGEPGNPHGCGGWDFHQQEYFKWQAGKIACKVCGEAKRHENSCYIEPDYSENEEFEQRNPDETVRKKERESLSESGQLSNEAKLEILRRGEYIPWEVNNDGETFYPIPHIEEKAEARQWFIGEWELFAALTEKYLEDGGGTGKWSLFTWIFARQGDDILTNDDLSKKLMKERPNLPDNNLLANQTIYSNSNNPPWDNPTIKTAIISYLYPMVLEASNQNKSRKRKNPDEKSRGLIRKSKAIKETGLSDEAKMAMLRSGQLPAADEVEILDQSPTYGNIWLEVRVWILGGNRLNIVVRKALAGHNIVSFYRWEFTAEKELEDATHYLGNYVPDLIVPLQEDRGPGVKPPWDDPRLIEKIAKTLYLLPNSDIINSKDWD